MADREKTTEEIIGALRQGQELEENFQYLFERYYAQIHRFFQRKGILPEESRDLTQEVFFSVYKGFGEIRDEARFESWLYRVAVNVYQNELERRRAKKRAATHVSLDEARDGTAPHPVGSTDADPMEVLLKKERRDKLREVLGELPPQMRRCVQLRVVKDVSTTEIAAILGISVNTVKAHLFQARKVLSEKLSRYFGEVEV